MFAEAEMWVTVGGEDVVEATRDVAVEDVLPELLEPGVDVIQCGSLGQQPSFERVLDGWVYAHVVHLGALGMACAG